MTGSNLSGRLLPSAWLTSHKGSFDTLAVCRVGALSTSDAEAWPADPVVSTYWLEEHLEVVAHWLAGHLVSGFAGGCQRSALLCRTLLSLMFVALSTLSRCTTT